MRTLYLLRVFVGAFLEEPVFEINRNVCVLCMNNKKNLIQNKCVCAHVYLNMADATKVIQNQNNL